MAKLLSPNFNSRPEGIKIDTLVIHYTGMKTGEEALKRLCDENSEVSAHYMIEEDGEIIPIVAESDRAWHAGASSWRGQENVNDFSIGIELVNPGHEFGYKAFPDRQIDSLMRLCQELFERHPIENRNVVGHSDIAPKRKQDPGELFDWEALAIEGIGAWPDMPKDISSNLSLKAGDEGDAVRDLQRRLAFFGYEINTDGSFGIETSYVVKAFQRHFVPEKIDGVFNGKADTALNQLLEQLL